MIDISKLLRNMPLRGCLILVFLLGSGFYNDAQGRKIRTTHKIEKKTSPKKETRKSSESKPRPDSDSMNRSDSASMNRSSADSMNKLVADSVAFDLKNVSFSGYDKTVSSSKESFLITNHNAEAIEAIEVKITYLDMKGRMLHSREVRVSCYVPAGETRKADISSWDTQRTYYYHLGPAPKKVATPYKVKITPLRAVFEEQSTKE